MDAQQMLDFMQRAELVYDESLRSLLEASHRDEFVAIEPISRDYYLGRTLSDAMGNARRAHPDRMAHAIRVGHKSALHFGASLR